jgi:poly(3-hydroxybutyrate) depolymerase/lysophospholipase L1-like esterase
MGSRARLVLVALALAVLLGCAASLTASALAIGGASEASCEPSPCQPAAEVQTVTLASPVGNDDGTASTREYGVYRPQNLVGPAPAVLVFYGGGNCGVKPASRFAQLAPANRFIVVYMAIPCERDKVWEKRNIDAPTTTTPDDEPYVEAVVDDVTRCPGECVDPRRIYAVGTSSGGSMVADVMCDVQSSPLFRGYMIDSSSLPLFAGGPHCPSPNRSFFAMLTLGNSGVDSRIYYDTDPNPHLDVPAFAEWAASRLGCAAPVQLGALGSPLASTLTYTYVGPCAYASAGSPAAVALGVLDGAHGWSCQDSDAGASPYACPSMPTPPGLDAGGLPMTNGLFAEGQFWSFVAEATSSAEPAPPLAETTPPLLTLAAPVDGASVSGTIAIDVHASDDSGLASVRLQLDGAELAMPLAAAGEGDYSLSWDTSTVANGPHTLRAIAVDAAGNLSLISAGITVANTTATGGGGSGGGGSGSGGGSGPGGGSGSGGSGPGDSSGGGSSTDGSTSASAAASAGVATMVSGAFGELPRWISLGDDYAAGEGNDPYLSGSDTATDRCHRSPRAYALLAAARLGVPAPALHACRQAGVASFYGADGHDHEPAQLSWVGQTTNLVTVSVGWNDAAIPASVERCGRIYPRCHAGWSSSTDAAIASLGRSRRRIRSLRRLFATLAAAAPNARVIAVGYPRPFAVGRSSPCRISSRHLRFNRAAMRWADNAVERLDRTIESAARATGASFLEGSYAAFAGHELCTRQPYLDDAFVPGEAGQAAIAKLLAQALASS